MPERRPTLEELREEAQQHGYSFNVGETGLENLPLKEIARDKKPIHRSKEQIEACLRQAEAERLKFEHEFSQLAPDLRPLWNLTDPNVGTSLAWKNHQQDTAYDLRQYITFCPVKAQGSCGACWAFAATGLLEIGYALFRGRQVDLSPQQIINCRTHACSIDFTLDDTFDYIADMGIPSWNDVPFKERAEQCSRELRECFSASIHAQIASESTVVQVKRLVVEFAGVASYIHATYQLLGYKGDAVFDEFAAPTGTDGHFVIIVGWDDTKQHRRGKGAWLVRNSWGTEWGKSGYGWIAYGSNEIADPGYVVTPAPSRQKVC